MLGDAAYPSRPNLLKSFKPNVNDPKFQDKRRFDESLNYGSVVIEKAFGTLKNRWRILKNLNMGVDRAAIITLACCVLHNYCEIFSKRVSLPNNFDQRAALFEAWVVKNPSL